MGGPEDRCEPWKSEAAKKLGSGGLLCHLGRWTGGAEAYSLPLQAATIFFVLNKIDYLSEREPKESNEVSARVVSDCLASEVVIHPLSARSALMAFHDSDEAKLGEGRLPAFKRVLAEFLLRDKGTTLLASMHLKLHALALGTLNTIGLEHSATRMPANNLVERIEAFQQHASAILQEQCDTDYLRRQSIFCRLRWLRPIDDNSPCQDGCVVASWHRR
jgi:hypothetical protein